jgi:2-oxoglutarate ferredoxin oxidoreductase subunit delta
MNKAVIAFERCKECHYCMRFCPKKLIKPGDKLNKSGYYVPVIDTEGCTGCATCARICPEGAITVERGE